MVHWKSIPFPVQDFYLKWNYFFQFIPLFFILYTFIWDNHWNLSHVIHIKVSQVNCIYRNFESFLPTSGDFQNFSDLIGWSVLYKFSFNSHFTNVISLIIFYPLLFGIYFLTVEILTSNCVRKDLDVNRNFKIWSIKTFPAQFPVDVCEIS